ncbi:Csu type fimbrial protein [Yersinia pekkanenii]|uniref:Csu type fimbrial protein n=1 Tax=Yersinia pekkanenii TaxID=1288385 RepID=UPI00066FCDD1|nr:spore coat U domain-containing protein [Yersinia pekkanenii]
MLNLVITCCLLLPVDSADAVTKNANIAVTATLLPTCTAGTIVNTNSFGTLNFGSTVALTRAIAVAGQASNGAISIQCSKGTTFHVLLNGGQSGSTASRYLAGGPSGQHVNYNLYTDAAHSQIWDNLTGVSQVASGHVVVIPVYGLVFAQPTPAVGTYTDTVQVTVNW